MAIVDLVNLFGIGITNNESTPGCRGRLLPYIILWQYDIVRLNFAVNFY